MSAFEMRPRSVTELVDATFELLRRDYLTLITISALFQLPLLVIQVALSIDLSTPAKIAANMSGLGVLWILGLIVLALSDAAIVCAVSDAYLGRKPSVSGAIGRALSRFFPVVFVGLLRFIASYVLLLAIVVPGLYCYSRWATARVVVVLEKKDTFESLGRSWNLAQGRVWPSFLTLLLAYVIFIVLWVVFVMILAMIGQTAALLANPNISMAIERVPVIFVYPFVSVLTTLIYYDLRVRKEAFDLEMMANELGAAPAPA